MPSFTGAKSLNAKPLVPEAPWLPVPVLIVTGDTVTPTTPVLPLLVVLNVPPASVKPVKSMALELMLAPSSTSRMPSLSSSMSIALVMPSPSVSSNDLKSTSDASESILSNSVNGVLMPALASKLMVPSESVSCCIKMPSSRPSLS